MAGKRRALTAQVTERRNPRKISAKLARELPKTGTLAARIRQRWGKAGEELPLERLATELGDSQRHDIVAALKELEKAGLGAFSVGKNGHRASFVWTKRTPPANAVATPRNAVTTPGDAGTTPRTRVASERHATDQWQRTPKRPSARDTSGAVAPPSPSSGSRQLQHSFHVRPQVVATFQLPEDVTRAEIERLCVHLQAIPLR